jgi:hypothetical protein
MYIWVASSQTVVVMSQPFHFMNHLSIYWTVTEPDCF